MDSCRAIKQLNPLLKIKHALLEVILIHYYLLHFLENNKLLLLDALEKKLFMFKNCSINFQNTNLLYMFKFTEDNKIIADNCQETQRCYYTHKYLPS